MLTAVALIAGMNVGGSGVDLFGLYGLAVLVNLAATLWAAGVAMRVRSIQGGPLMQFPVFLILFLAPVYVPLEPAQRLDPRRRLGQPGHRCSRPVRGFIAGHPVEVGVAYLVAAGLIFFLGMWAIFNLRHAEARG